MAEKSGRARTYQQPKHQGSFMRITIITLLLACGASPALADLRLYESFDYAPHARLIDKTPAPVGETTASPWFTLSNSVSQTGTLGPGIRVDVDGDHDPTHPGGEPTAELHDYMRMTAGSLSHPNVPSPVGGKLTLPATPDFGNKFAVIPFPGTTPASTEGRRNAFFSFTLQLADLRTPDPANPTDGQDPNGYFFAGFIGPLASTATTTAANLYGGQLRIRLERDALGELTNSGKYQLGFVKNNSTTLTESNPLEYKFTEQAFSVDEMVHIVGQYEFIDSPGSGMANPAVNDVARLWINPTLGGEGIPAPTIENATGRDISNANGVQNTGIQRFWLRSNAAGPGNLLIDELRIGTTFADVTPLPVGMPGDFNGDLVVNGNDFLVWQRGGTTPPLSPALLQEWKDNFGTGAASVATASIPEPSTFALGALAIGALFARRRMGA